MGEVAIVWLEPSDFTLQSAAAANGNGEVATLDGRFGSLTVQVVGSTSPAWGGTINFEASQDNQNYVAIKGRNITTGAGAATATASGTYVFDVTGLVKFRARQSGFSAGTVTVTATATAGAANGASNASTAVDATIAGSNLTKDTPLPVGGLNNAGTGIAAFKTDAQQNLLVGLRSSSGQEPAISTGMGNGDGTATTYGALATGNYALGFNGATWDRVRVPNVYRIAATGAVAAAGSFTVWTPATGKKIRLMGAVISASIAGIHQLKLGDTVKLSPMLLAGTSIAITLGQGTLAGAANDLLTIFNNNGNPCVYYITAWGTEE